MIIFLSILFAYNKHLPYICTIKINKQRIQTTKTYNYENNEQHNQRDQQYGDD